MTSRWWVAHLQAEEGRLQERGPYIGDSRNGSAASLYVLIEGTRPPDAPTCHWAQQTLAESWRTRKLSLTSALLEGLRAIHERLREENRKLPQPERQGLGLSCLILREADCYLVQAGPSLRYLLRGGRVEPLAPPAPEHADAPPLGMGVTPRIRLCRLTLAAGDTLLLASPHLEHWGDEGALASLFTQGPEAALDHLKAWAQQESRGAMLILARQEDATSPPAPPSSPNMIQRSKTRTATRRSRPKDGVPVRASEERGLGSKRRQPPRWSSRGARASRTIPWALLSAGLAGALMASYVLIGPMRPAPGSESALLDQAAAFQSQAHGAPDRDSARQATKQALTLVEETLKRDAEHGQALALRAALQEDVQRINGVRPLREVRLLANLGELGTGTEVRSLLLGEDALYLLDTGRDRVYHHPLEAPYPKGGTATPGKAGPRLLWDARQGPRSNLADLLWMPRGGLWRRDSLLLIDEERRMWEQTPQGVWQPLPVRGAQGWVSFGTAAGYQGNLYVLDPAAAQVWRYIPTDAGYDSERKGAVDGADLKDAVDLAVDGNIYVLERTGRVWKFTSGRPSPFSQEGIDKPLVNPTRLFAGPGTRSIYVLDTGNQRVVVLDKEGRFQGQWPLQGLPSTHDLAVDEARGLVYFIGDNQLHVAQLPTKEEAAR